jgi:Spy/CpxP family protein refolding chaperone
MGRKAFVLAAVTATLLGALEICAQPLSVPPGRWWQRPRVAAKLGLTAAQKQKLETTTVEHARVMIDLKATVEKAELELRLAADASPFDADRVRAVFARLQQARMRLETERFELLLAQRELLSPEQWQELRGLARELMERRRGGGGAGDQPGQPRRQPPGRY